MDDTIAENETLNLTLSYDRRDSSGNPNVTHLKHDFEILNYHLQQNSVFILKIFKNLPKPQFFDKISHISRNLLTSIKR